MLQNTIFENVLHESVYENLGRFGKCFFCVLNQRLFKVQRTSDPNIKKIH